MISAPTFALLVASQFWYMSQGWIDRSRKTEGSMMRLGLFVVTCATLLPPSLVDMVDQGFRSVRQQIAAAWANKPLNPVTELNTPRIAICREEQERRKPGEMEELP
jgi:hypothetical protein